MSSIGGHTTTLLSRSSLLFTMLNVNKWATVPLLPELAVMVVVLFAQLRLALSDSINQRPAKFLCPRNSPGKSTRGESNSLLQRILPTQGSNAGPVLQAESLLSEPPGKPSIWPNTIFTFSFNLFPKAYTFDNLSSQWIKIRHIFYPVHQAQYSLLYEKFYF